MKIGAVDSGMDSVSRRSGKVHVADASAVYLGVALRNASRAATIGGHQPDERAFTTPVFPGFNGACGRQRNSGAQECRGKAVSGTTRLTPEDQKHLDIPEAEISTKYCRPGCDACFGSCPQEVPIWDVLRYKMYFENYGEQKYAMAKYLHIPASRSASACVRCNAPCEPSCRYRLPVRERLLEGHAQLSFAAPGTGGTA